MNAYAIFNTLTGQHVVSHTFQKRIGLAGAPEGGTQMLSVAAMGFGLLANAAEGIRRDPPSSGDHDDDGAAAPRGPSEANIGELLAAAGILPGDAAADTSANTAALRSITLEAADMHFFQHAVYPIACLVVAGHTRDHCGPTVGARLAERLLKAFCHDHGNGYLAASASGVARPYRKAFAPNIERVVMGEAARVTLELARLTTPAAIAPPAHHYIAFVSTAETEGRWALNAQVSVDGTWEVTFGPLDLVSDALHHRVLALDRFKHEAALPYAGVARVEVNAGTPDSFSAVECSDCAVWGISTLRLAALEESFFDASGTAASAVRVVRSFVHALAKVRTTFDRITFELPLVVAGDAV